jgi:hypothetical protein
MVLRGCRASISRRRVEFDPADSSIQAVEARIPSFVAVLFAGAVSRC